MPNSNPLIPFNPNDPPPPHKSDIVKNLKVLIETNKWETKFQDAIKNACDTGAIDMEYIRTLDDYYNYLDWLVNWIPREDAGGEVVYNMLCTMYFVLDQDPVKQLQSSVEPAKSPSFKPGDLTTLSNWIVDYAKAMGEFLSKPESLTKETLKTFYDSPRYHMDDYTPYDKSDWKNFNEFFCRHVLPGKRPIDDPVIVSPADSTFDGKWPVDDDSYVSFKGIPWNINELLSDSPFKDKFAGGTFMHAFLNTTDYHRQHAPIAGKVKEARVIQGQCYLQVKAVPDVDGKIRTKPIRKMGPEDPEVLDAPDDPGYQFCQTRGLIVIDADDPKVGLVAVLPIGMAQVSSVVLNFNKIDLQNPPKVAKGEEISHFEFGGSDIVLVFQAKAKVDITATVGVHYNVGRMIGIAKAGQQYDQQQ